jgi:hypothetical protein
MQLFRHRFHRLTQAFSQTLKLPAISTRELLSNETVMIPHSPHEFFHCQHFLAADPDFCTTTIMGEGLTVLDIMLRTK